MPIVKTQFPASISVTNLNGVNGFAITNFLGDSWGGYSVSGAGDVNGDGIDDLIVGAILASSAAGASYVLFGRSGIGDLGDLSVSNLASNGFVITGFPLGSEGGFSVSRAGDVNGDGIADLIVGAPGYLIGAGAIYVILGQSGIGSSGSFNVSRLTGSNGFVITGFPEYINAGSSVSGAGDVNDDGVADLIIGAPGSLSSASACYVIFGQSGIGGSGSFNVSRLTGSNGFAITGFPGGHLVRDISVAGAGDVNDDGVADLIIGVPYFYSYAGASYVLFGNSAIGSSGNVYISSLRGSNGFAITGFPAYGYGGWSLSGAGDVNDDGVADLIVGAIGSSRDAGASYVLFGQSGIGSSGSVSVSSLTGSNGFVIMGFPVYSNAGSSVSGAGDVNDDGIADLIIGASYAFSGAGASYVIFGHSGIGSSGSFNVSRLTGSNGFAIAGFQANSWGGNSVSGAADVNGDGIADLIIGAPYASNSVGACYVIFGEFASFVFLSRNQLTIKEDQTLSLTSQNLNVTNPKNPSKDSTFQFTISGIQHGRFYSSINTSLSLRGFTQQQVRNGQIYFSHDGSPWAPSFNVSIGYPGLFAVTLPHPAMITFQQSFVLVNNVLTINQGQTVILTSSNLSADDLYNSANNHNLVFSVSNVQHGYFALKSAPSTTITMFTQTQIQNSNVQFIHDGSTYPPSYSTAVMDGAVGISAQAATVSFDIPPVIVTNTLTINQGETVVLSLADLSAFDPYTSSFTFTVSNVQHGYFALTSAPTTSITSFTQAQIKSGDVQFVHDGSINAPSYGVSVSDGRMASSIQAGNISFDATPVIESNSLTVNQGQTVILSSSDLSAINSYNRDASLSFTVDSIQHGYFALTNAPAKQITSFTQSQIQSGAVQFVHDGSAKAPSFNVAINNWPLSLRLCMVTFNVLPVLDRNVMSLQQGQSITLGSGNLHSTYLASVDPQLTFVINKIQNGFFALNGSSQALTDFTQAQVDSGAVRFISDGSIIPPSYAVAVSDGLSISTPQIGIVNFTPSLLLVNNTLLVSKLGQTIVLSDVQLDAVNPGNSTSSLSFTVSNIQHGFFSLVSRPSTAITHFTQQQLQQGKVQFSQDGSNSAPSYQVTVTDGRQIIPSQSSHVIFNLAPQFQTNRLSISSGGFVILSSSELSATDPDDPAEQLVFTVSQVEQGVFTLSHGIPFSLESFTQAQVQAGDIAFLADGGPEAPSYLVGVSDGYSTTSSIPEITFTSPSAASAIDEATVRNAIYGGTAGGVVGLLFFFVQLYLNRRMTKNLLVLEKQHETEIEKQQADYYKHAVKPIVERLFSEVDTTIICGYRGEKDTLHYQAAVESIVNHLGKLGNAVDTRQVSPAQYSHLRNSIIDQIKIQAKKNYKCCSKAYCCHFFKPEISAKELEERAAAIATAVSLALSSPTSGTSLQSPISGSSQRSVSDVELATVGFNM